MSLTFQRLIKNNAEITADMAKLSLVTLLQTHLNNYPEKQALVFVDPVKGVQETLTYKEFFHQVLTIAQFLKTSHKLKPGDAVALNLENTPEILLFHLVCWLIGCITVPLDLKRDDLDRKKYKIELTNCKLLISAEKEDQLGIETLLMSQDVRSRLKEELPLDSVQENLDNTCLILFTSGTTHLPKGVQLSLANLLLNADGIKDWLKITAEDRFHIVLPLHHINSTTMSLATLLAGGTIVLSSRYSKSAFWQVMAENQATLSSIVPTICFDMLTEQAAFKKYEQDLKQVTRIQIGSAPVMQTDVIKFYDLYKIKLVQGYGSTETALRVTGVDWAELSDDQYRELVKSNTIGGELKWNNLEVLKEDGSPAGENEEGEICIRGPILTKGYLDNDQANKEAFIGDWFHSGDLGYWRLMFGKKVVFINGRKKEIIIKGGVNISPLLVEHAILENYPAISTCYVAGAPDKRYGEEVGVVVAFDESVSEENRKTAIEQLKTDAKQGTIKGVSAYESPKYIIEVPLASLPATSTGKIQRVNIKQYFQDIFTPIAESATHYFRKLTPFDTQHIAQLVKIHNTRWGSELGITIETAQQAVTNGIVIAALDKKTWQLAGSAFGEIVHSKDIKNKAEWLSTYDQATGNLILKPSTSDGDVVIFVTISTDGKPFEPSMKPTDPEYQKLLAEAPKHIDAYLASNTDPVMKFHMTPKAGMKQGASILYPIANARPKDTEALGYCVMMKYPTLPENVSVQESSSLGTQILEAGFIYAVKNKINSAYAYSRPSGFLANLVKL